jgi:plastocyanin
MSAEDVFRGVRRRTEGSPVALHHDDRTRRRVLASAAGTLLTLALAGCSSSSGSGSGSGATTTGTTATATAATSGGSAAGGASSGDMIMIQNFAFSPATLSVAPGATVTVMNKDSVTHTVTSTASPASFDTGDVAAGATVTFKAPAKAGSYNYICSIHTYMHGTLTVQ